MYYLLNKTQQIIAADESLLALCGLSHIDELSSKIILGDSPFKPVSEDKVILNNNQTYTILKTSLSSMLGDLTLVNLTLEDTIKTSSELSELLLEDNFLKDNFLDDVTADNTVEERLSERSLLSLDADLISIKSESDEETFSFNDTQGLEDLPLPEEEVTSTPHTSEKILIDIENISQRMGLSHEDYNAFLDEYIDTALGLEADLQSEVKKKRADAISTLSQLAEVLRLPVLLSIIQKISTAPTDTNKEAIVSFYDTLSRLTTQTVKEEGEKGKEEEISLELFDMPLENTNSFGTISLDDIKPIHFDFQLKKAANDLSLPVELIEEFVRDFIKQAHSETKIMLEAYENGDLDTIQKIGHLLKGASSNLRINALSDTLSKIQFCEDTSNLETLIKEYWGHFLSFEIKINALAK